MENPTSIVDAFTNRYTNPLVLDTILISSFGNNYYTWLPETCWMEIKRVWGTDVSSINKAKINSVILCMGVDSPYKQWPIFEKVIISFANLLPDFSELQKPNVFELVSGMYYMKKLRNVPFSDEVQKYGASVFLEEDFVAAPPIVDFLNKHIGLIAGSTELNQILKVFTSGSEPSNEFEKYQTAKLRLLMDQLQIEFNEFKTQSNVILKR